MKESGDRQQRNDDIANRTRSFTYDGDDRLVQNWGGNISTYLNGPGIDNKVSAKLAGGTSSTYYHLDHLGTTTGTSNTAGSLSAYGMPDSFGNGSFEFTGREYDSFTELNYYRARMYDPQLGRFTSEDPIGFSGGDVNLYGYVHSNSVNKRDPFGLIDPIVKQDPRIYATNPEDLDGALDVFQAMLAGIGMIPVVGEPVDGIDGLISLGRGDYTGAGMSAASMIPFAGWGAGVTKFCRIGDRLSDAKGLYRPYLRKSTRGPVFDLAERGPNGEWIDANTRELFTEKPHLGHTYGNEYWRMREQAMRDGLTQKEFNDLMNDPNLYQIERPINNQSHKYEMPR